MHNQITKKTYRCVAIITSIYISFLLLNIISQNFFGWMIDLFNAWDLMKNMQLRFLLKQIPVAMKTLSYFSIISLVGYYIREKTIHKFIYYKIFSEFVVIVSYLISQFFRDNGYEIFIELATPALQTFNQIKISCLTILILLITNYFKIFRSKK